MTPSSKKRLILLGWDAADWKVITPLLDSGQMPALASLVERGCMGNIATLQPPLSPILWTSIMTGHRAARHGVTGFVEPTLDGCGIRPIRSTSRTCKALWNIAHQAGIQSHAIGFWASHPAEPINGVCVSDQFALATAPDRINWPMPDGAVHPSRLRDAVRELRVHPSEIADADLIPFIPRLAEISEDDPRPRELARIIAKAASVQAVLTALLENEPWGFVAAYFDAIDITSHHFMPFHPPRSDWISKHDFELYREVVAGMYRFHDLMLKRVLDFAGDDTTIVLVSDHGFHSDHLRPSTPAAVIAESSTRGEHVADEQLDAAWHRPLGIFCVAGPNVKRDERVYGANLLDVAPTVLTMLDLPIGRDMPGKVLSACFASPPNVQMIESWEQVSGDGGMHEAAAQASSPQEWEALQQLVALGYLATPSDDATRNAARAAAESRYNLALSEIEARHFVEAEALLRPLRDAELKSRRFTVALAQCLYQAGRGNEAAALLEQMLSSSKSNDRAPDSDDRAPTRDDVETKILLAAARFSAGQQSEAVVLLETALHSQPGNVQALFMHGSTMLALRQYVEAEKSFRAAMAIDDTHADAIDGLAGALLGQNRFHEVVEIALQALSIIHHFPMAHLRLGVALFHLGEFERATRPLSLAASMQPDLLEAHRYLATAHRNLGNVLLCNKHRELAEQLMKPRGASQS